MNIKSGVQTSEFWVTLITSIIGLLVMTGIVSPNESNNLVQSLTAIVGGIIMIAPAVTYIFGRTWLKRKALSTQQPTNTVTPTA